MKALTLTNLWAVLTAIDAKHIETRSWKTAYRGPLAIHAAKSGPKGVLLFLFHSEPFQTVLRAAGYKTYSSLPLGCVVATCELVDCKPINRYTHKALGWKVPGGCWRLDEQERAFGHYAPGRWAWLLGNIKALPEPIPARGALGLWEWDGSQVGP